MFPNIVTKTIYIRKCIKLFHFYMNPQKTVMNYGFILFRFHRTLTPIRNTLKNASVNAIREILKTLADSSRVRKSLHKCERSINIY